MANHDDYKEMLAARGLGALDAIDARALETHLRDCADCRQELEAWEATAAALALAAAPMAPSNQVRDRIIEAVRADVAGSSSNTKTVQPSVPARSQPTKVDSLARRRQISPAIPAWAAIAAGLVFVALLGLMFVLWQQNKAARQELARLTEQVRETQRQTSQQREAIEIVTAPGARISELAGTKGMPAAHAVIAFDKAGRVILIARGLPPPPAGKAYQLWFIAGGKPLPGKVFVTDAAGVGTLTDHVPTEAMNSAIFAITLEPATGVQAPTGAIYLSSKT